MSTSLTSCPRAAALCSLALAAALLAQGCASQTSTMPEQGTGSITPATAAARAQALPMPEGLESDAAFQQWVQTQRQRLQTERQQAQQRHDEQAKTCWRRFAVNDCLRQLRQTLRTEQDALRQQELALNAHERQRRSGGQLGGAALQTPAAP